MIIATAGHIDHGKTKLVEAITGINSDRLPDEKVRGISIDLGFAYRDLGNGLILNFIDVPGHKKFINNMLAGYSSIDFGLLVIAADDGPMPQTEEHLSILQLLKVKNCAVVLSKIDKVEKDRLSNVICSVKEILSQTNFSRAKIFQISIKTKEGINNLINHLKEVAAKYQYRVVKGNFRLSVDRKFLLKGAGIVVTGTVVSGKVNIGDEVIHSASGHTLKIRTIHSQSKKSKIGLEGQRCALNITGRNISIEKIFRGDWILSKNVFFLTTRLYAVLLILKNEVQRFKHWTCVHLYLGSGNVTCRIAILGNLSINPGEKKLVQLVTDKPVHAVFGDKFVIRDVSSRRTVGGGSIIDPFGKKSSNSKIRKLNLERLKLIDSKSSKVVLNNLLLHHIGGIDLENFLMVRNLTNFEFKDILRSIDVVAELYKHHKWLILRKNWVYLQKLILDELYKNQDHNFNNGTDLISLSNALKVKVPDFVIQNIINESIKTQKIKKYKNLYYYPKHFAQNIKNLSWWYDIEKKFKKYGFQPPKVKTISTDLGIDLKVLEPTLKKASSFGYLIKINENRYILSTCFNEITSLFEETIKNDNIEKFTIKNFSQITGITRNLSVEILEYFDKKGFTKRLEEGRVILKPFLD